MIEYQVVRSTNRKSIALHVKKGKVTVRAPKYISERYIKQLIHHKKFWLEEKLLQQKNVLDNYDSISFINNGVVWLNGGKKNIHLQFDKIPSITQEADIITIVLHQRYQSLSSEKQITQTRKQVEAWLKKKAIILFNDKVNYFSETLHLTPKSVKVRQYKARWGSCNNRGELSFNYLLLMTPDWVIDYVVVHELCHLTYLNHSKLFWQLVAQYYPRYKEAQHWLKSHQAQLTWSTHQ